MILQQAGSYFSIKHLPLTILENLTVLTGINGAGKSHLLQAIQSGNVRVEREDGRPANIRMFDWTNMVPNNANQAAGTIVTPVHQVIYELIEFGKQDCSSQLLGVISNFAIHLEPDVDIWALCEMSDADLRSIYGTGGQFDNFRESIRCVSENLTGVVETHIAGNSQHRDCMKRIIQERNTLAMVDQEYLSTLPFSWEHSDLFQHSFAELFLAYFNKQCNNYVKLGMVGEGKQVNYVPLSNEEFTDWHGKPPWDFVNESMQDAGLDFAIDHPTDSENRTYRPTLTKKSTGDVVEFNTLSSGEKILMSFAFCLYHSTDPRASVPRPNLLLLDEVDAPLHPSMCQRLMKIINETLVIKNGIDVIFVTHSPTTIAVAPDESIYLLEPGSNRISKETKRQAVSALTVEIPTMSINFDSRRQVFVESSLDAKRYEKLYRLCGPSIKSERSLVFIGMGQKGGQGDIGSGSDKVKSIVKGLQDGGNESVFGLVDWDRTNQPTDRVKVLARGSRYAIENCLLDPLFIAALMMQVDRPSAEQMLGNQWQYVTLSDLDPADLQKLSTAVQCHLLKIDDLSHCEIVECGYIGGVSLNVAKELLEKNGHEFEFLVKEIFPPLKKYKNVGKLLDQIIQTVAHDHFRLIPIEIKSIFEELSSA